MIEKEIFGELTSEDFDIGDIVEWTTWNKTTSQWDSHYGILLEIGNKVISNRVVSISKVMPINESHIELEFFTASLKLINKANDIL
jgi:hypothetical protein